MSPGLIRQSKVGNCSALAGPAGRSQPVLRVGASREQEVRAPVSSTAHCRAVMTTSTRPAKPPGLNTGGLLRGGDPTCHAPGGAVSPRVPLRVLR